MPRVLSKLCCLLSNWNSLELVYVENKDCIEGYTARAHRPGGGNWKPARNPGSCLLSLLVLCSFQIFLVLLFLFLSLFSADWLPGFSLLTAADGMASRLTWHICQDKARLKTNEPQCLSGLIKVYFFSHYSSSVGDRHTTISWCCHLNRWFQGCQQQNWRWGSLLIASAQKGHVQLGSPPVCPN